ncbi:MAG: helix-turn-helix domain-containing protein [Pseudonocardiaceae bacterium]
MDSEDGRTIGRRLRQLRKSQGKSLQVIADLSGVLSAASLSRIENGLRALDRRSEIVALADALRIAPSELTRLPVPAPGNGDAMAAEGEVRKSLTAVSRNRPSGQVLPLDAMRIRVRELLVAGRQCRQAEVSADRPRSAPRCPH